MGRTLRCGRRIPGIPSHSRCTRSGRCSGLMLCRSSARLLQELTVLQAGFWLINASQLPYSLGNVEISDLQVLAESWIPAPAVPSHRGLETSLAGCQVHVFSVSLAKKLSQPLPPFHWTPPKPPPPDCFLLISFNVLQLCYSASSMLLLKKANKKNTSKAFSLLLTRFPFL